MLLPAGAGVSEREVLDKDGDDVPDWLPWDVRQDGANGDPERRAVQAGDGFFAWGNQDARINRHDWGAPGWNHCTPGVPVD